MLKDEEHVLRFLVFTDSQLNRARLKMITLVKPVTTATTTETFGGVCASVTDF